WGLAKVLDQPDATRPTPARASSRMGQPEAASGSTPTQAGQVVGTPSFMPPEQASGLLDRGDQRSDVFGLGATLHAVPTGRPPYDGPDVAQQATRAEVAPARQVKRSVPAALEAVCQKAMARRPEDRYGTARELAQEVERWLADEPVGAYRPPL